MEMTFSAKTLDEAQAAALEAFKPSGAVEMGDLIVEILEQPVKKLFGYKGEYKISVKLDEVKIAERTAPVAAPSTESAPAAAEAASEPAKDAAPETTAEDENEKIRLASEYLIKVITALGAKDFKINPIKKDDMVVLDVVGDNLGIVIGRRGETLDSLQYLAILASNRNSEPYCRIAVDCNGYRDKRRETLESLAERTARKVLKQGRRISLEPMNPYERRIIHSKVAEIEGVFSHSTGEEPYRKVVISATVQKRYDNNAKRDDTRTGTDNRTDTRDNRDNRGGNRGGRRYDNKPGERRGGNPNAARSYKQSSGFTTSFEREYKRQAAPATEPVEYSQETVDTEKNTALYGKIDL